MTADVAFRFAWSLECTARDLGDRYSLTEKERADRSEKERAEDEELAEGQQVTCFGPRSNLEPAIASLKRAAHWYREVGRRGYGVEPWSEDRC